MRGALLVLMGVACGCAVKTDPTVQQTCIAQNPASNGGWGATDLLKLEASCDADHHPCDHRVLMSEEAATCIAKALGLPAGIGKWTYSLHYVTGDTHAPAWDIKSTLQTVPTNSGRMLMLNAQTGDVIIETDWGKVGPT